MTEAEWLAGDDPFALLAHVGKSAGWRKRQLYCLACWDAMRAWHSHPDYDYFLEGLARLETAPETDWCDEAVRDELSEGLMLVDGGLINRFWDRIVAGESELQSAYEAMAEANLTTWDDAGCIAAGAAYAASSRALHDGAVPSLGGANIHTTAAELAERIEANARAAGAWPIGMWWGCQARNADLVREVFGNPFRSTRVEPAWLAWGDGVVARLARDAYEGRAFDHLTILADALEDAGCTDDSLLSHLRSPGPHVRGCWALDLILAKQ